MKMVDIAETLVDAIEALNDDLEFDAHGNRVVREPNRAARDSLEPDDKPDPGPKSK